jgi:hypothetical protein
MRKLPDYLITGERPGRMYLRFRNLEGVPLTP